MTADELWEKHTACGAESGYMIYDEFLAALTEYGNLVKAEAVKVCESKFAGHYDHSQKKVGAMELAAAIKEMELP